MEFCHSYPLVTFVVLTVGPSAGHDDGIHHMSRTPFLILNFLDFDGYVVMTPTFPANHRRCASFSKDVAILSLWSKWAIIVPNNLI